MLFVFSTFIIVHMCCLSLMNLKWVCLGHILFSNMAIHIQGLVTDQIKQQSNKSQNKFNENYYYNFKHQITIAKHCDSKTLSQQTTILNSSPFFSPYFLYSPAHTPLKPSPSWVTNIMPFLLRAMSDMKTWRPYAHRHCLTELPQECQQNTWQRERGKRRREEI